MRKSGLVTVVVALALTIGISASSWVGAVVALEYQLSGAIFTTIKDGSEVNANIYDAKCDLLGVYLDGGPGQGAPQHAAGLPDGDYFYQITDPSGKTLLSTDPQKYRRLTITAGIITARVAPQAVGDHDTGFDVDHGAVTVEMCPFLDTPNNGGEYKAWLTPVGAFTGDPELVDNGYDPGGPGEEDNFHGFVPSFSKTDNFKVKQSATHNTEIDTQFINEATGLPMDGVGLRWIDTNGAGNKKWSYYDPRIRVDHFAHVEAPEVGTHKIVIEDQPGCRIYEIHTKDKIYKGPATVSFTIKKNDREWTKFMTVYCIPD